MVAFLTTIHPMRLGVTLLMISRRQPMQNLLAYWIGCVLVGLLVLVVPLMVLHVTPTFASFTHDWANAGHELNRSGTLKSAWVCSRYRSPR